MANSNSTETEAESKGFITQVKQGSNGVAPAAVSSERKQVAKKASRTNGGQLGAQPVGKEGFKTLVLDLDETLVHSAFKEPEQFDIKLPVAIEEREFIVYVQIRPGCFQFLQEMSKHYEVIIYTASLSKYADPLMNILDPEKLCTSRLFREHCTFLD